MVGWGVNGRRTLPATRFFFFGCNMISGFFGKYRFLSNFWPAVIVLDGITYPTAEHAYQAAKTDDQSIKRHIALIKSPGEVKKFSRAIQLKANWNEIRIDVMTRVQFAKYDQNADLRQQLLDTGDHDLVEVNNWKDRFWGVYDGGGYNHLGVILMKVRKSYQENLNADKMQVPVLQQDE